MGLDSVELVMEIENYFNIRIKDEDAEGLYTASRVVDHVSLLLGIDDKNEQLLVGLGEKLARACNVVYSEVFITEPIGTYIDFKDEPAVLGIQGQPGLSIPYLSFRQPPKKKAWWQKFVTATGWFEKDWSGVSVRGFRRFMLIR